MFVGVIAPYTGLPDALIAAVKEQGIPCVHLMLSIPVGRQRYAPVLLGGAVRGRDCWRARLTVLRTRQRRWRLILAAGAEFVPA